MEFLKSKIGCKLFLLVFAYVNLDCYAQDWDKRHEFAKSYFGISNYIYPNVEDGKYLNNIGEISSFERSGFVSPAINIGATHFWGFADFYVSINTSSFKIDQDKIDNSFRLGTFTGLRLFPLASKINTVRPYLGYKFSPFRYKQTNINQEEFKFTQVKSVFDIGIGYQLPNFYFTLEYGQVVDPNFEVYLSRENYKNDKFPKFLLNLGLNYTIETTKSASTELNKRSNALFSSSNKWGFFCAAGPSSSFPVGSSTYVTEQYPYLDDKSFPTIFPDIALGYHFSKLDLIIATSFRPISQKRKAFGFEQELSVRSINFESYAFLADYHGFAPYVGIGISNDNITVNAFDDGVAFSELNTNEFNPNFVFGWDIRPSVKGDWWLLRTNLRYYPFSEVKYHGSSLSLKNIEFNFIQFVFYPQRFKKMINMSTQN